MSIPNQQTEPVVTQESKAQNDKDYNFAQIRKQLEQERAARVNAEERASRFEQERSAKHSDDEDSSDEPYVDHKLLEKKFKKFESTMDERIERKAEEKARALVDQERKNGYLKQNSDFNEVMQPEIMQKFVEKFPGLAEGLLNMPDGFERQKLVFENIKALGVHKKEDPCSPES